MKHFFPIGLILLSLISCQSASNQSNKKNTLGGEPVVVMETTKGTIRVKLYNETPLHRDNFLKLVDEGFFNGIIFHRVINAFMVQAGDPSTKQPSDTAIYGNTDTGYTIPAEFNPTLYHKKGALAAARTGDDENPLKASSGSQFYLVQGKVFRAEQLNSLISSKNEQLKTNLFNRLLSEKATKLMEQGKNVNYQELSQSLKDTLELVLSSVVPYGLSPEQIETYTTVGGTPHLDGDYTVFGEVIEGLEVVDVIAGVSTSKADRPIKDVVITKMFVETK